MQQRVTHATLILAAILLGAALARGQQVSTPLPGSQPEWESCEEMHDTYVRRFESSRGFGLSRMPQPAMLDRVGLLNVGRTRYVIDRIELISILKHDPPVAYVPPMHASFDPKQYGQRELSAFETRALAAFRAGRDLERAPDAASGRLQCAGTLRATGSCLKCHDDKKAGDLLGAFSYALRVAGVGAPD